MESEEPTLLPASELMVLAQDCWYAAITLQEIPNRTPHFWVPSFYLQLHALELALKAIIAASIMGNPPRGHNLEVLLKEAEPNFNFTEEQRNIVAYWAPIHSKDGGLRYPENRDINSYYPQHFEELTNLVEDIVLQLRKEHQIGGYEFKNPFRG